ncbi:unnamed protein product [Mytilus edulis]|uniref:Reverse transcriptase domain-containing protein n=1 Tax=Mytilus edulis TaxID=6550 RepID=A0A8S3UNF9_MYTED|nr:unnamed protein product [Mytilus edulis]
MVLLQETFWDDAYVNSVKHLYEGDIYCSNSLHGRRGVAVLVNNYLKNKIKCVYKDSDGRFIHITYEEDGQLFNVISLYAPNVNAERVIFFNFVKQYTEKLDNLIIGGDFNTSLSMLDRGGKSNHVIDEPCKKLCDLIENNNLYDVWRTRNKSSRIFSWKRICNGELQQSRIDYFLVNKKLSSYVQNVYYNTTSLSDHSFVIMNFNCSNIERGPGLWVLNNTLLCNEEYVRRVKEIISDEKENELYNKDLMIWWDNLKYKIKRYSQIFSSKMAKENRRDFYRLERQINFLCEKAACGVDVDVAKLENLKLELSAYELEKCRGAVLRSKAIWAVESDKCTKYFLNLEKYKQENNSIKELLNENNESVYATEGILDLQYKFYKELYSCVDTDNDKMSELLDSVDTKIDDNDCNFCDADISHEEIFKAINQMSKNKSPGSDGLTVEFYCQFYNELRNVLFDLFNVIEKEGVLGRSMKCGVISLIYKKKGDKKSLKNYRPISLLQVDYKILARIMANRFKVVLPKIVSNDQTCCIIGRDISNNIANVRDIIELIEKDELEGYIMKLDQEKAFDRVSHKYLLYVLRKYGFGDRFVKWIEIFYNGINSAVKCNGFLTNYFHIKNGIRQGCPISALLYVLAAEPLHCRIVKNDKIKGIKVPNCDKEGLIYQHADDTTLSLCNKESIPEVFKEFDLYSKATGAKINRQKSEIICLGTGTLSVVEKDHIGLKVCEDYFQLLGVFIGKNRKMCDEMNWKNKIVQIKSLLNLWLLRRLTIHGRVSVINSLMLSRFWYALFVTALPEWAYIEIKRLCLNFIWKNGCHLVKYNCIIDDKSRGGLNVADIKCKIYAFRLKFLGRLLDDEYQVLWKYTFKYFVSSIYEMKLCHNVFYTVIPNCELKKLPVVYQEFFHALNCIRKNIEFPLSVENVYDQPLFVNPNIVLNNRTIVWHDFIGAGIVCLKDICFEVKTGFLPDHAIVEMIQIVYEDVNVQYVVDRYRNLLNAIPVEWKNTVNSDIHRISMPRTIDISIICKNVHYDLKLCSTKTLYTIMLENIVEEPVGIELWKSEFDVTSEAFSRIWEHVNMYWKPSNLVELDFKVLHNCIFTNVKLQKIGLVDDNICKVCCSEKEDILHIFINCDKLEDFHNYLSSLLVRIFENCDSDKISLVRSEELLILALRWHMKGVNDSFLNFFMSVARYCIFRRRNLLNSGYSNVNLIKLFQYTLKHYVTYMYVYLCQSHNMSHIFQKKVCNG